MVVLKVIEQGVPVQHPLVADVPSSFYVWRCAMSSGKDGSAAHDAATLVMFRQWVSVSKMVGDGVRRPEDVSKLLASIIDSPVPYIDWLKTYAVLGMYEEGLLEAFCDFVKRHKTKACPDLWFTPVIDGLTCGKVVATSNRVGMDVWTLEADLDAIAPKNDRSPKGHSYAVGLARAVEADERANHILASKMLNCFGRRMGATLLERLLIGLGYFLTTHRHLDERSITLCSGSAELGGNNPTVYYERAIDRVYVGYIVPPGRRDLMLPRPVEPLIAE